GMVRFLTGIKDLNYLVLEKSPEAVIKDGQVQAWLLGSGIEKNGGKLKTKRKIKKAICQNLPTVLDAGAINFVTKLEQNSIITPHYKELQELFAANSIEVSLAEIKKDPAKWAKKASLEFKTTVLLKGNTTIICDEKSSVEIKSGTTYLATAGTGDVLSGILGSLVATNYLRLRNKTITLLEIAQAAVLIHQEASLEASNAGPISASMIIEKISPVIGKVLSTKFI
ncbi:MAG: NAD(P)H-hydrate dehydratase, partial [Actinomycetes bacterium]